MLDGQRIGQPQIVWRRDVWIVARHGSPLPDAVPVTPAAIEHLRRPSMFEVCIVRQDQSSMASHLFGARAHRLKLRPALAPRDRQGAGSTCADQAYHACALVSAISLAIAPLPI